MVNSFINFTCTAACYFSTTS